MKKILGLDLGTNSIGWALVEQDFEKKQGQILGLGSRIIPMSQDILGKFDAGQSHSQTAERTNYRGVRRLYQRDNLRRDRLHRTLNVLQFLPKHYEEQIDFEINKGQFIKDKEPKINYFVNHEGKHEFLFKSSFNEMVEEFKTIQPDLFYTKSNGIETKIPYDWTIYFLRKKALNNIIEKEELAWLILHFNQKRGYYQLRGEEVEETNSKQFVELKVKEIIDSGESVKGKTLYNIVFENGWVYDRQIVKAEDWEGRTKEFIVTEKSLKDGTIKRTYKSVDSEKDWPAIKAKTEKDIELSQKTVGEYIYASLLSDPSQKIRGKLIKTIERKFYRKELEAILNKQIELQPELFSSQKYTECIMELYPLNESHRKGIENRDFNYLFVEDIIFYQRPLKSQKSNIGGCQFETRVFKKQNKETGDIETVKESVKAIPKSHPLFQEFRLWQWLQNLKIYNKEEIVKNNELDITQDLLLNEDDWTDLYEFLSNRSSIEQKHVIDYFVKKGLIKKADKENYRWNYVEDKSYPSLETRSSFLNRLKKVNDIKYPEKFLSEKTNLGKKNTEFSESREVQLWHLIYSVNDMREYESGLRKFAAKYSLDEKSFVDAFIKYPPFGSDFASYSKKAIGKLLPLMKMGSHWDIEEVHQETRNRIQKLIDGEFDEKIRNRVREKAIHLKKEDDFRGLPLWLASYVVYNRHSEVGDIQQWKKPEDIDLFLSSFKQHSLRNPIVEQVVLETLRVVRDIWKKNGDFAEIHVELGREMKNPSDKRKKISDRNNENENTNIRIKEVLNELLNDGTVQGEIRPYSPSHQEILKIYEEGVFQNPDANFDALSEDEVLKFRKSSSLSKKDIERYKLWLEQGYLSPYTGKPIQLSKLFTTAYQIEHIIPQSRYFDNSLGNKVICESDVNEDKDNKTAFEYLKEKGGQIINGHQLLTVHAYEEHVGKYFKKNRVKLKNLLSDDIPEGFINRQLNDSRYISKLVKGLLSNIVREDNEQEATSKHLISTPGAITSKLKQDWGLNDKWNELIAPRFERLNTITKSNDFGYWDKQINAFRIQIPDEISKGFSKKRIDHRHHALDALVIACTTRDHVHYLSALNAEKKNYSLRDKLLIKNKQNDYTKNFMLPWNSFPIDAKEQLDTTIVSFKQNNRIINKTNNKFWSYRDENGNINLGKDGKPKKKLRKQTNGDSWAIRKPMHKETVSGVYSGISTPKGKIATAVRTSLSSITNQKHVDKITDRTIREVIIPNHLKNYPDEKGKPDFERAFSAEGIEDLNSNIIALNNGKYHKPIQSVKMYEIGSKFSVGEEGPKAKKYVEAAKGTNLFFSIYWDENKQKRNFETIPLNEVIAHQKQVAHLDKELRTPVPVNSLNGNYLFSLSPNDLVFVPNEEELRDHGLVNFDRLSKDQTNRIYKMVSSSGTQCFFIANSVSTSIQNKFEFSTLNKMERAINDIMIKDVCWKLEIDNLGATTKVLR